MKLKLLPRKLRRKGMAIIGIIIIVGAVLIIAGSIIYMLFKLCKRVLPPDGGNGGTNNITAVFGQLDDQVSFADTPPIQVPDLKFPELAKPQGWTPEKPFGNGCMELQRSTNLIDWETICVSTNPGQVLSMDDDTNPPPDRAFYRGKFVYP